MAAIPPTDIQEVFRHLPHRFPFVLVDAVEAGEAGEWVRAVKHVSIDEPFFTSVGREKPAMPATLIVEALAQAAAILSFKTMNGRGDDRSVYYFVGIDKARFKRPVTAGDTLMLDITLERYVRGIWKFWTEARVEDKVVTEAELMCTVRPLKETE